MKLCLKCGEVKSIDQFHKNKRKRDGFDIYCKDCKKAILQLPENKERSKKYQAAYYQEHRDKKLNYALMQQKIHNIEHSKYTKRSSDKKKSFLDSIKTPCRKCGESRLWCIDFHHIDPAEKKFNINNTRWGWDKIIDELKKVVCLCANCHREFHAFYGTNPTEPVESLRKYLNKNPYELIIDLQGDNYE